MGEALSEGTPVSVTLRFWDAEPTAATAVVVERSLAVRIGRALVALIGFWALAAVSLLIPIAHFLLVPGFYAAGLIFAWRRLRERTALTRLTGTCPRCQVALDARPGGPLRDRRKLQCPSCKNDLELRTS